MALIHKHKLFFLASVLLLCYSFVSFDSIRTSVILLDEHCERMCQHSLWVPQTLCMDYCYAKLNDIDLLNFQYYMFAFLILMSCVAILYYGGRIWAVPPLRMGPLFEEGLSK